MTEDKRARLDAIVELLRPDEAVMFDARALLFDPGGGLKKREAEGYVVLTDQRVIFGTVKHGVLVDLPRDEIKIPARVRHKYLMSHLDIATEAGATYSLVLKKAAALEIAHSRQ